MDAKTLARAVGMTPAALSVWQQRDLIPSHVGAGAGRRRSFDIETAVRVAVMALLARAGFGLSAAARIAAQCDKSRRYLLVMPELPPILDSEVEFIDRPRYEEVREAVRQSPITEPFDRLDQLDGYFERTYPPPLGPPPAFTVIDCAAIHRKMQALEDAIERDAPAGELAGKRRA